MTSLVVILALILLTVASVWIGEKTHLPYPVLLLLFVIAASFLPFVPIITMDPDLILPLFLPPLLYAVARRTSWSIFVRQWRVLLLMAVGLTAVTAFAVGAVVMWLVPGIGLPLALALGAIVSPADPVSLEVVAEPANVPRSLLRALQTESLFNDAMAIVLFVTAVSMFGGGGSFGSALISIFTGTAIAVVVGWAVGWLVATANRTVHSVAASGAMTVFAPFFAYLAAGYLHASGVVAVVVVALEINRREPVEASRDRILTSSFWDVVELVVTGVAFGLMGSELRAIVDEGGWSTFISYSGIAFAVLAVILVLRVLATMVLRLISKRTGGGIPRDWRDGVIVVWCGMRGLSTLALALSLPYWVGPTKVEHRGLALVVAAVVLFVTLVPPGLLLPWLIRTFKPVADPTTIEDEAHELTVRATAAVREALEDFFKESGLPQDRQATVLEWADRLRVRMEHEPVVIDTSHYEDPEEAAAALARAEQRELKARKMRDLVTEAQAVALEAARAEVLAAAKDPTIDFAAISHVLQNLDLRAVAIPVGARHRSFSGRKTTKSGTAALSPRRGRTSVRAAVRQFRPPRKRSGKKSR